MFKEFGHANCCACSSKSTYTHQIHGRVSYVLHQCKHEEMAGPLCRRLLSLRTLAWHTGRMLMIISEEKTKKKNVETQGKAKENTRQDKENSRGRAAPSRYRPSHHSQNNLNKETNMPKKQQRICLPRNEETQVPRKLENH